MNLAKPKTKGKRRPWNIPPSYRITLTDKEKQELREDLEKEDSILNPAPQLLNLNISSSKKSEFERLEHDKIYNFSSKEIQNLSEDATP